MQLQTPVPIPASPWPLRHGQQVLCLGSCFAEHMGQRLQAAKFRAKVNPFGILYQPTALAAALGRMASGEAFSGADFFEQEGLWRHFELHSRLARPSRAEAERSAAAALASAREGWPYDWLFVTLGTAHAYWHGERAAWVANCHKVPARHFEKRLLDVDACVAALRRLVEQALAAQPDVRIVLTVSPVRHWREGAVANQRSKATLLLACAAIERAYGAVSYFPAYEMMMDELRDYRFYAEDMLHPSPLAQELIWGRFGEVFFEEDTRALLRAIGAIQRAAAHRPQWPGTAAREDFLRQQREKLAALAAAHPGLDFSAEWAAFGGG